MNPEDRLRELRDPDRWQAVRVPNSAARTGDDARIAPVRLGQLVAAFAIAIVVVTALVLGLNALHGPTPPASTPVPSPSSTARSAAPTTFSVVPGATHRYTPSALPPACTLAQLRTESKQDGGGALGTYIQAVFVENTGADCTLAPDAIRVGGSVASIASATAVHGLVLPSLALGRLTVDTAEVCQPNGTTANIDLRATRLPIVLNVAGRTRTMTARFPRSRCSGTSAEAYLDDSGSAPRTFALTAVAATVDQPARTPRGPLHYDVRVQTTGSLALVLSSCPTATEVLSNGLGTVVTRALALRCTIGSTLEPDVPVTVPVSTTIPTTGDWTISWYLGGASGTTTASSTCTLAQLQASEGEAGAAAGSWVQVVTVRDRGADCTLPVTAFSVGGTVARAGRTDERGGFALASGSTTRIAVAAATVCADGAVNITSTGSAERDAKPVALQLGGRDAAGLDQPFPRLRCAGPYVDRLG